MIKIKRRKLKRRLKCRERKMQKKKLNKIKINKGNKNRYKNKKIHRKIQQVRKVIKHPKLLNNLNNRIIHSHNNKGNKIK